MVNRNQKIIFKMKESLEFLNDTWIGRLIIILPWIILLFWYMRIVTTGRKIKFVKLNVFEKMILIWIIYGAWPLSFYLFESNISYEFDWWIHYIPHLITLICFCYFFIAMIFIAICIYKNPD